MKSKILKKNNSEILQAIANNSITTMKPSVEYTAGMNVLGRLSVFFSSLIIKLDTNDNDKELIQVIKIRSYTFN